MTPAAPETVADDERFIAAGYQRWLTAILAIMPFVVASFAETKWVVATGFGLTLVLTHVIGQRAYDLCTQLRRTNLFLHEGLTKH